MTAKKRMRLMAALCVAAVCTCAHAASPAPGEAEFGRSTAELAASLILQRLQDDVLNAGPDSSGLASEMSGNPGKYIDPEQSRSDLKAFYADGINAKYREEAGRYLDRLAGEAGREAMFGAEFLGKALSLPEGRLGEAVEKSYPGVFDTARRDVCKAQADGLVAGVQPTEQEFDELPQAQLSALLTQRISEAQKSPVFKENLSYITDSIVKPMLSEADAQRKRQRVYIENRPVEGWTPGSIGTVLSSGLAAFVGEVRKESEAQGRFAYGVFPSVSNAVPDVAGKRAFAKAARTVEETDIAVDPAVLLATIEKDPAAHRTQAESLAAFAPELEKRLENAALERSLPLVPESEREAFREFYMGAVADGRLRGPISGRVRNVLLPQVKSVREECAAKQAGKFFAPLMDGTWFPDGALVDSVLAAVDYKKAVAGWREFAAMESFARAAEQQPLIEEALARVDGAVAGIFDRARKAHTRQHAIVDDVFGEIKTLVSESEALPDFESATRIYSGKVQEVWAAERDSVVWGAEGEPRPGNADAQHAGLFPSTVEKIKLKVKSLMESIEKERREKEKEPEPTPEDTPQSPAAIEELEPVELDCRFEIDQRGNDIEMAFYSADSRKASLKCPHSPAGYRKESGKMLDGAVAALVSEVGDAKAGGAKVNLKVSIVVKSDLVYYGAVYRLVKALNAKADEFSGEGVSMEVKDGMSE